MYMYIYCVGIPIIRVIYFKELNVQKKKKK